MGEEKKREVVKSPKFRIIDSNSIEGCADEAGTSMEQCKWGECGGSGGVAVTVHHLKHIEMVEKGSIPQTRDAENIKVLSVARIEGGQSEGGGDGDPSQAGHGDRGEANRKSRNPLESEVIDII